jgi:betaine-aldehyde dehydrogenase
VITLKNIINGQAVDAPASLPFFDPATGLQIGTAPDSDATAVDLAFQAAQQAFKTYKRTTPGERQALLLQLADLIDTNADRLLEAEVACTGKPRAATRELEILRGADQLRFFAGACRVGS